MDYKFQYDTKAERDNLISQNSTKYLIEEQNISDGNFLIFSDEPIKEKVVYIDGTEAKLKDQADNQLVIMDVLATMYEDMLAKGTV